MKRALCLILALSLALSAVPAASAAGSAPVSFTDIKDAETLRAANLLAALGIVSGAGGSSFNPNGTFTRAHLAVIGCRLSGVTDTAIYSGTVKFPDVRAGHWAHGWIMAALDHKIVTGDADGNFYPDRPMLYGYLVTVLMKLLGYTDADVGMNWPSSYIGKAEALGLSSGMRFGAYDVLTRGQAARLIYNFLFLCPKQSNKTFLEAKMNASYMDVMLRIVSQDGADYAEVTTSTVTSTSTVKYPLKAAVDKNLSGRMGKLLIDGDGYVLGFEPDAAYSYKSLTVQEARPTGVLPSGGGSAVAISYDTPVRPGSDEYQGVYLDIFPGDIILLAYRGANLEYIYWESRSSLTGGMMAVLTAQPDKNPLAGLFGSAAASARIVKNGVATTWQTLEQWDVLVYYAQHGVVTVSNNRFIGVYSNGSPNTAYPTSITVQGKSFSLWPSASAKMENIPLGSRRVFLLDPDGKIADVRTTGEVADLPPVLVTADSGYAMPGSVLLGGEIKFSAKMSYNGGGVLGQLCAMNNYSSGELYVTRIELARGAGDLDLSSMKLGATSVAPWCAVYECAGTDGIVRPLALADIPVSKIPRSKILHAQVGPSGYVTTLLLDDVTGDCFWYGTLQYETLEISGMGGGVSLATYAWVEAGSETSERLFVPSGVVLPDKGTVVGISQKLGATGAGVLGKISVCVRHDGLTRYSFDGSSAVYIDGRQVPLAVDSVWVPAAKTSMTVAEARAYCSSFTCYTDADGYKVRFIIGY